LILYNDIAAKTEDVQRLIYWIMLSSNTEQWDYFANHYFSNAQALQELQNLAVEKHERRRRRRLRKH